MSQSTIRRTAIFK